MLERSCLRECRPPLAEQQMLMHPRRKVLDSMLINAAAQAGAEVRQGFTVEELLFQGTRVMGIRRA
jgi:flavin-dependent dehydrogenase